MNYLPNRRAALANCRLNLFVKMVKYSIFIMINEKFTRVSSLKSVLIVLFMTRLEMITTLQVNAKTNKNGL